MDIKCNGRFVAPISVTTGGKAETFCTSEDRANARLIVNAPKMYDILERFLTEKIDKNEVIKLLNNIDKTHRKLEKTPRPTKDEYYLNIAEAVMQRSTCLRRRYGAVIVKNDEIISTGYNGSPRGEPNCDEVGHCYREENKVPHGEQYEKCLSGETIIKLLNGTYATMKELTEKNEPVWVYSVDEKTGKIVPGMAHHFRKVKQVHSLLRIFFDDGGYIDCTPEHKFLMRDLTYKEANNLLVGDSIMPCNYTFKNADHEYIHNTSTMREEARWILDKVKCETNEIETHKLVYTFFYGIIPEGYVVHHVDFNSHNNIPDNLVLISKREHISLHSKYRFENGLSKFGTPVMFQNDPEFRRKKSENGRRNMELNWANENGKKIAASYNSDPNAILNRRRGRIAKGISDLLFRMKVANEQENLSIDNYERMRKKYMKHSGKGKDIVPLLGTVMRCFYSFSEALELGMNYNHKVLAVEHIVYDDWVYDVTVDDFHNFAVKTSEGKCVIVHNCSATHGEMNAIISASRNDMIGATLYLASDQPDAEPCEICRRLIKNAGITKVVTREKQINIGGNDERTQSISK